MHPAVLERDALLSQCEVTRTRRSGPGGQNRNKVETAIVLVHRPSGISVEASERRSQGENLAVAVTRLRRELAVGVRSPEVISSPSPLWMTRLRGSRLTVNPDHDDYPPLLAESLDHLAALDWNVSSAAQRLQTTASQLVGLWKNHPPALDRVNQERRVRGLRRLM
ncbi:MAG: peptide chain release factor-like protein [Planctomycetota bacterium]|nr:MAG: peptide chain release factor-like protein [Planctomycetota bacterium]